MIRLTKQWYIDVANICEAYRLFYDKSPAFHDKKDQIRIKAEFQTMVYLIEYGLEIVLRERKYPTYYFYDRIDRFNVQSKELEETINYIMELENPNEYVYKYKSTLNEDKKRLIKRYGRLFCIKFGNPASIEDLLFALRHYYWAHQMENDHKITLAVTCYERENSLESLKDDCCIRTNGFIGEKPNFLQQLELEKREQYEDNIVFESNGLGGSFFESKDEKILSDYAYAYIQREMKAARLGYPFIHYVENFPATVLNWDKAKEILAEEETAEQYKRLSKKPD